MRDILFRGYSEYLKKWVFGNLSLVYEKGIVVAAYIDNTHVKLETVGQFSGINDKNDVKIFEGDIAEQGGMIGEVIFSTEYVWSCGCFNDEFDGSGFVACCEKHGTLMELSKCRIIGNIYDNPELLDDKEDNPC